MESPVPEETGGTSILIGIAHSPDVDEAFPHPVMLRGLDRPKGDRSVGLPVDEPAL